MDIYTQLKQIGLNKSEIRVYLFLLENGISTPPQIAKETGIARTNCYNVLGELKMKGLVEIQQKAGRKAYLASDPESLLRALQKKKEAVERLLPDLRALYTVQKNKPQIRFYEGLDQVKEIYHQTYQAKEIFAIGSTQSLARLDVQFFIDYNRGLKEKNIVMHDILSYSSKEITSRQIQNILKGLWDAQFLPSEAGDLPTDILIWGDNVAMITLQEPIFGTVLTNQLLAKTFRAIHSTLRRLL